MHLSRRRLDEDKAVQVNALTSPDSTPSTGFIDQVKIELPKDKTLQEILRLVVPDATLVASKRTQASRYKMRDGLLWFEGSRLVVPKPLRLSLLQEQHDTAYSGHPSHSVLYAELARHYFWPGMSKDVKKYVKSCDTCQRQKDGHQHPYGLLQPLPIPSRPWGSISMDFIVQLPKTPRGFTSITVFVDRLTKMVHLAPSNDTDNAPTVAQTFLSTIFRHHGLPDDIVSDRGSVFTSHFWTAFLQLLGTKASLSTAFHPQSDGQTERVNRTVEQMLRLFIDYKQTNWDTLLPLVEFAVNNHKHSATQHSPFFLNFGFHPKTPSTSQLSTLVPSAVASHQELQSTLALVKDLLKSAQDRMTTFANAHRTDLTFSPGDHVMLSSLHITPSNQVGRPSKKLAPRYLGPYKVLERVGQVSYKLELPASLRIHPTFHISRLRPYTDPSSFDSNRDVPPRPPPDIINDQPEFEVEKILDKRRHRGRTQYLVKWVGYPDSDNTWEPEAHLSHAIDSISDYESLVSS